MILAELEIRLGLESAEATRLVVSRPVTVEKDYMAIELRVFAIEAKKLKEAENA